MKLSYYHKALIIGVVGLLYTNVPHYIYDNYGFQPKYWYIGFCLLSLPMLIKQKAVWNSLKSPVTVWCFGYAALTLLWFFLSSQSETAWQEVRYRFLAIIQILAFLMIFCDPDAIRLARRALVGAVLFAVAVNIYELFDPMSFSHAMGRSAGLYANPNIAGEALVLGMILCITVLSHRYRAPLILVTGIGILVTLSRAAIVMWVIAAAGLIFTRELRLKDLLTSGTVGLLLAILLLLPRWDQLVMTWQRTGVVNVDVQERLEWFTNPAGVSDFSSWERKYVAQRAWDKISERPFLGNGTGSSYESYTAPHNQYLSLMMDHGFIGLLIVPLLVFSVTWGVRGETGQVATVFGCAILVLSLFTHSILTEGHSLTLFPLMASMTAMSVRRDIKSMCIEHSQVETAKGFVRA